jgi:hypothetical protein
VITQSTAWEHPNWEARAAVAEHARLVLDFGGVVIRYGLLYGPDTYYPESPPAPPRIHVEVAARRTVSALDAPPGIILLVEDGRSKRERSPPRTGRDVTSFPSESRG